MEKNAIRPYLTQLIKINLKWIKDKLKPETTKLLEENIEENSFILVLSMIFWGMTSTAQATNQKINQCEYIKLKSSAQQKK